MSVTMVQGSPASLKIRMNSVFPFVLRALIKKAPSVRQLWKFRLFHKEGTAGKTRILFPQLCNNMSWTD